MKYYHVFITIVLLFLTPIASANITAYTCADDGDGGLVTSAIWNQDISTMNINGVQHWYPGHILGSFTTDTEVDPTVWFVESIENQTNFAWTDYHIDIGMNKAFSIVGVIAPPDWTWAITPPAGGQPGPLSWVGKLDYYAGTPIAIGGSGSFGFVVSFTGSVEFFTSQVPTGIIPAPGAILLGSIGIGCISWQRRRKSL